MSVAELNIITMYEATIKGTVPYNFDVEGGPDMNRDEAIAKVLKTQPFFQFDSIEENGIFKHFLGTCTKSNRPIFDGDDYCVINTNGDLALNAFVNTAQNKTI